ncbi:MAG: CDP-glycerol glycerophosphotransferase family protein [Butyrivibrio sp.]|nr:CDP-glycerol glycerophosphotransferase family protein [Butyrivibrio sp.]
MSGINSFYIDPGTGAMLFTTIIGIITTASFAFKKWFIKLKFFASGGRDLRQKDSAKLPIVIFSDSKRYWNVFKPICDELEKRKQEAYFWTLSPDDPALKEKYEYIKCSFIGEGNHGFARLNMMNAYICLSTTPGLDVYQWRRSKDTEFYAHVLHSVGGITFYRMFGLDFYDALLLAGSAQIDELRNLEKVRKIPEKEVEIVGAPSLDRLYEQVSKAGRREKRKENPTVLLAPSWGDSSLFHRFGDEFLKKLRETGYQVIIRPHPQSRTSEKELLDRLEKTFPEAENWHWNYDNDNFDSLMNSDILITDFSGIIFDYTLVFDGPVIYTDTEMDLSPYDACWVDDSASWKNKTLPSIARKITTDDIPDIKSIIDEVTADEAMSAGREKARQEAWMHQGESASITADYLIAKLEELKKGNQKDE